MQHQHASHSCGIFQPDYTPFVTSQAQTPIIGPSLIVAFWVGLHACTIEDNDAIEREIALEQASSEDEPSPVEHEQPDAEQFTSASGSSLQADFNGDGYADLAIGVPAEVISGAQIGGVNVIYGSANGLTPVNDQFWSQATFGVQGLAEDTEGFGEALAAGDFNSDGYVDLAIGVPFDRINGVSTGSVNVLYGSASGLTADGDQLWNQDSPGIEDVAELNDHFGFALASGDFDGDGWHDLAIGVPLEDSSGAQNAGAVHIIYGSPDGLTATGNRVFHQDTPDVDGIGESFEFFGRTLAAADFNNDGNDDLAIGVPDEDVGPLIAAGSVNVLYGSNDGLMAEGDQTWHQDSDGIEGEAEEFDRFSGSLAVGDFDGDGFADLVVGVPGEGLGSTELAGAINVIYGSSDGLTEDGDRFLHQDQSGIKGEADAFDQFGWALATGDFDEDGRADLAVGVPGEGLEGINNAGVVQVLYGSSSGLSGDDDQRWNQNTSDVTGVAEDTDRFGSSLAAGDYDGDGITDLVIGVPFEDVGVVQDAGAVNVLYGTGGGLTGAGDQVWHQDILDVIGVAEANDNFGDTLR